jgi:hypothetical protein
MGDFPIAVVLAVIGGVAICGGSFFAIIAPGDGQTGMCCCPLVGIGALCGIGAVVLGITRGLSTAQCIVVSVCGGVAVVSIAWSVVASQRYERRRRRK